jgi:hypothetical protein
MFLTCSSAGAWTERSMYSTRPFLKRISPMAKLTALGLRSGVVDWSLRKRAQFLSPLGQRR